MSSPTDNPHIIINSICAFTTVVLTAILISVASVVYPAPTQAVSDAPSAPMNTTKAQDSQGSLGEATSVTRYPSK